MRGHRCCGDGIIVKGLPQVVAILLMIVAGFAAGMAWALIRPCSRSMLKVDEVVTTCC